MDDILHRDVIRAIRESYDQIADEYAFRIYNELQNKLLDCALLDHFHAGVGVGELCDMELRTRSCRTLPAQQGRKRLWVGSVPGDIRAGSFTEPRHLFPGRKSAGLGSPRPITCQESRLSMRSLTFLQNVFRWCFRKCGESYGTAACSCSRFTWARTSFTRRSCGLGRSPWISFFFGLSGIRRYIERTGLLIDKIVKREPYPDAEYQSRRAYIFARGPGSLDNLQVALCLGAIRSGRYAHLDHESLRKHRSY